MRAVLHWLVVLLLAACGPAHDDASQQVPAPSSSAERSVDTAAVYGAAVVAYINALRARDGSLPDTVYIGRHDEFPHIELPANMEHASVRIIAPSEAEVLKQGEHFRYLNIFGTLTPGKAEFFVVNFGQGMRHWPDGRDDRHLLFSFDDGKSAWVLDSLWR